MNPIKPKQICLLSLGNPIMGDDGIGLLVMEQLKLKNLPQNVKTIELGIDPLNVLSCLDKYQYLIFIDAVCKEDEPGNVYKIDLEELINARASDISSFHYFNILDALKLAKSLGYQFQAFLIGINVGVLQPREGISHKIQKYLHLIVEKVLDYINQTVAQISGDLMGLNNQEEKKDDR